MNVSFYQAAAAMNANARWQELISENLAAGSVPGFKKQEMSFAAIQAGLMPHGDITRAGAPLPSMLPTSAAFTNFSGGELKTTGVKTDVAIEGPGFFEVQLPSGGRAYTRDGEFQLNAQSQLVTKQGFLVLGENGPLQFDANNGPISISPDGDISQGADIKGSLKVVNFNNPKLLTQVGGGLFEARDANLQPVTAAKATLRQGWLEGSNTSATAEMANMITAMRSFEANQKVVQLQDERLGRMITELGTPS
ncbi:MAG TPA: flagellar hook-basal body protein [Candidatus Limnocylindria bacterium]|nr:flagellar hook-basal body protein [Candidatus Limnocylindria bacterium]